VPQIRLDVTERLFELQAKASAPSFALSPMGELFCNGVRVGDVRAIFAKVVAEELAKLREREGES
jgi:hypothetical protein